MQKLSRIHRFIIIICAGFILINSESMVRDFNYLDYTSVLYTILICMVVYIASLERIVKLSPLNNAVTFILILYLISRLSILSFYPDALLGYNSFTPKMYNDTLLFILVGTITCYLGLGFGFYKKNATNNLMLEQNNSASANRLAEARFKRHLSLLSNLTICFLLFGIFVYYYYGYIGATGSGEHLSFFRRYVVRFFDPRMMLCVTIAYYYWQKKYLGERVKRYHKPLIIAVALFFILQTYYGSRAAGLQILFIFLAVKTFVEGDFKIKVDAFRVVLVSFIGIILVYTYMAVTIFREYSWMGGRYDFFTFLIATQQSINAVSIDTLVEVFKIISHRMGILWTNIYIINVNELGMPVNDIVNFKTSIMSIINRTIPGKIFGDMLFQEYAFGLLLNVPEAAPVLYDTGTLNYIGYTWSMYGISYQLFGFYGGAFFIFFISFLFSKCALFLKRRESLLRIALGVLLVYMLLEWVGNFGIDNWADKAFHSGVLVIIYVLLFQFLKPILAKFNRYLSIDLHKAAPEQPS